MLASPPSPSPGEGPKIDTRIRRNRARGGVEIIFSGIPAREHRERLLAGGFKFSSRQRLWYARETPERVELAKEVARAVTGRSSQAAAAPEDPAEAFRRRREEAERRLVEAQAERDALAASPAWASATGAERDELRRRNTRAYDAVVAAEEALRYLHGEEALLEGRGVRIGETYVFCDRTGLRWQWRTRNDTLNRAIADVAKHLHGFAGEFRFDPTEIVRALAPRADGGSGADVGEVLRSEETIAAYAEALAHSPSRPGHLTRRYENLSERLRSKRGPSGERMTRRQLAATETAREATMRAALRIEAEAQAFPAAMEVRPGSPESSPSGPLSVGERIEAVRRMPIGSEIDGWVKREDASDPADPDRWEKNRNLVRNDVLARFGVDADILDAAIRSFAAKSTYGESPEVGAVPATAATEVDPLDGLSANVRSDGERSVSSPEDPDRFVAAPAGPVQEAGVIPQEALPDAGELLADANLYGPDPDPAWLSPRFRTVEGRRGPAGAFFLVEFVGEQGEELEPVWTIVWRQPDGETRATFSLFPTGERYVFSPDTGEVPLWAVTATSGGARAGSDLVRVWEAMQAAGIEPDSRMGRIADPSRDGAEGLAAARPPLTPAMPEADESHGATPEAAPRIGGTGEDWSRERAETAAVGGVAGEGTGAVQAPLFEGGGGGAAAGPGGRELDERERAERARHAARPEGLPDWIGYHPFWNERGEDYTLKGEFAAAEFYTRKPFRSRAELEAALDPWQGIGVLHPWYVRSRRVKRGPGAYVTEWFAVIPGANEDPAQRRERWRAAETENEPALEDLKKGDRVWSMRRKEYVTVVKVMSQNGSKRNWDRVRVEGPKGTTRELIQKLRWLSDPDLEEAVRTYDRVRPVRFELARERAERRLLRLEAGPAATRAAAPEAGAEQGRSIVALRVPSGTNLSALINCMRERIKPEDIDPARQADGYRIALAEVTADERELAEAIVAQRLRPVAVEVGALRSMRSGGADLLILEAKATGLGELRTALAAEFAVPRPDARDMNFGVIQVATVRPGSGDAYAAGLENLVSGFRFTFEHLSLERESLDPIQVPLLTSKVIAKQLKALPDGATVDGYTKSERKGRAVWRNTIGEIETEELARRITDAGLDAAFGPGRRGESEAAVASATLSRPPQASPGARLRIYRSGLSRPRDFGAFAAAGVPLGVQVGELGEPMIERIVRANAAGAQIFFDNGAFPAFQRGEEIDAGEVYAKYAALAARLPRPELAAWVACDVIGNQRRSFELLGEHKEAVRALIVTGGDVLVPLQKGELSLAQAFEFAARILETTNFRAALPANEAAVSREELLEFVAAARPGRIHLLGIGRKGKLLPLAEEVYALHPEIEISSDSNALRALVGAERTLTRGIEAALDRMVPDAVHDGYGDGEVFLLDETEATYYIYNEPAYLAGPQAWAFARLLTPDRAVQVEIVHEALSERVGAEYGSRLGDFLEKNFSDQHITYAIRELLGEEARAALRGPARAAEITAIEIAAGAPGVAPTEAEDGVEQGGAPESGAGGESGGRVPDGELVPDVRGADGGGAAEAARADEGGGESPSDGGEGRDRGGRDAGVGAEGEGSARRVEGASPSVGEGDSDAEGDRTGGGGDSGGFHEKLRQRGACDFTEAEELRIRDLPYPAYERTRAQIARWREHQRQEIPAEGLTLEDWAEFDLDTPDGRKVRVLFQPRQFGEHTHVEFWGPKDAGFSSTGYCSQFFRAGDVTATNPVDAARLVFNGLLAERGRTARKRTRAHEREPARDARAVAEAVQEPPPDPAPETPAPGWVKPGGYVVESRYGVDTLMRRVGDRLEIVPADATRVARIKGILEVRDRLRDVRRAEETGGDVRKAQDALLERYLEFVVRFGPLSSRANVQAFQADPDASLILSLGDDLGGVAASGRGEPGRAPTEAAPSAEPAAPAAPGNEVEPRAEEVTAAEASEVTRIAGAEILDNAGMAPGENTVPAIEASEPEAVSAEVREIGVPSSAPTPTDWRADAELIAWLGSSSKEAKFRANVDALVLLKALKTEGRTATKDEQRLLARYTGWGQFPQVFDPRAHLFVGDNAHWKEKQEIVAELLGGTSSPEYERAKASTLNAHYTHPQIAELLALACARFGVTGGRILEPAVGTGNMLSVLPESWLADPATSITAVELDPTTAAIARHLFPESRNRILTSGFEDAKLPNGYFDVAISNVPFGEYSIHDSEIAKHYGRDLRVHNYFFAAALEKVREGGIVAFITSAGTLDAATSANFRRQLGARADFLGAVRLPSSTFLKNAGTSVTTDMIFLQRRPQGMPARHAAEWFGVWPTGKRGKYGHDLVINEYFVEHPEQLLGEIVEDKIHPGRPALEQGSVDLALALPEAIERLPQGVYQPRAARAAAGAPQPPELPTPAEHVKEGAYVVLDGEDGPTLYVRKGEELSVVPASRDRVRRVGGLIGVRDAVRNLLRAEIEHDDGSAKVDTARRVLNERYEKFRAEWGPIYSKANERAYDGDPDLPLLKSLERVDSRTKEVTKAPIFVERVVARPRRIERSDTPEDALAVSLAERGAVDLVRIAELLGPEVTEEEAAAALVAQRLVFRDPESDTWLPAEEYLSGDVLAKLETAERVAALDPSFAPNVAALREVQPSKIAARDIGIRLGAPWVPESVIAEFIREISESKVSVKYIKPSAEWVVTDTWKASGVKNTKEYGTDDFTAVELATLALNLRLPTVWVKDGESRYVDQTATEQARDRQEKIKRYFKEWVFSDEKRVGELERIYNERFNRTRLRVYDGSPYVIPGLAASWAGDALGGGRSLRPHQYAAVRRMATGLNTLLAHEVGAGKTAVMSAGCAELKRRGLVQKPMMTVPNHLVAQAGRAYLEMFPRANILVQEDGDFAKDRRAEFLAKIATGTWDAVILAHSSFGLIGVKPELAAAFVKEQIDDLQQVLWEMADDSDRRAQKRIEASMKRLESRLERLLDAKKDSILTFEDLGVDCLVVDEFQAFKNLAFSTKLTRVAGLSDSESKRAEDLFLKKRYLESIRGRGRGLVGASGTPITNTIAEMYTLMRFFAEHELKRRGIAHFDAWVSCFAECVTGWETDVTGKFSVKTRFSEFTNLPELMTMFRQFSDVQTAEMIGLPRPERATGSAIAVTSPQTSWQRGYMEWIDTRVQDIKQGAVDPDEDNMLKVSSECRKLSLDPRLLDARAPEARAGKVALAIETIHHVWEATKEARATQVVFSDLGTPGKEKPFTVYEAIKRGLVARGVPEQEIAFIHDYDAQEKKLQLYDRVNAGEVRIVFGSSAKLGAGANIQQRLIAIHHLDVPWLPADLDQRNGRIERQGNRCERFWEFRYVTQGNKGRSGFDAYMWELVGRKSRFINQVMRGDSTTRKAEDISARPLTYAEFAAISHGNPLILEKVQVDAAIEKLERLHDAHLDSMRSVQWEVRELPKRIEFRHKKIARMRADWEVLEPALDPENFRMKINGTVYTDRKKAGEMIHAIAEARLAPGETIVIGEFGGLEIGLQRDRGNEGMQTSIRLWGREVDGGRNVYEGKVTDSALGPVQSLSWALRQIPREIPETQAEIRSLERRRAELDALVERGFEHGDELDRLRKRQAEINDELGIGKSDAQAANAGAVEGEGEVVIRAVEKPARVFEPPRFDGSHMLEDPVPEERPWLVSREELRQAASPLLADAEVVISAASGGARHEEGSLEAPAPDPALARGDLARGAGNAGEVPKTASATAAVGGPSLDELRALRDLIERQVKHVTGGGAIGQGRGAGDDYEAGPSGENQPTLF